MNQAHHHFLWLVYLWFILGELTHVFKRSSMSSLGVNPSASMRLYLARYWNILIVRGIAAFVFFALWIDHPQFVDDLLTKYVHWDLDLSLPPTKFIGAICGYVSDSALDWLAQKAPLPAWLQEWVRTEIPAIPAGQPKSP